MQNEERKAKVQRRIQITALEKERTPTGITAINRAKENESRREPKTATLQKKIWSGSGIVERVLEAIIATSTGNRTATETEREIQRPTINLTAKDKKSRQKSRQKTDSIRKNRATITEEAGVTIRNRAATAAGTKVGVTTAVEIAETTTAGKMVMGKVTVDINTAVRVGQISHQQRLKKKRCLLTTGKKTVLANSLMKNHEIPATLLEILPRASFQNPQRPRQQTTKRHTCRPIESKKVNSMEKGIPIRTHLVQVAGRKFGTR